jgi:hypothetical protein
MSEANYDAAINAFDKAVKLVKLHKLEAYFKIRCTELFRFHNADGWYIDNLRMLLEEQLME